MTKIRNKPWVKEAALHGFMELRSSLIHSLGMGEKVVACDGDCVEGG